MRKRTGAHAGERGVAVVELALVLPVLAVVVFGTIDLGRIFRLQSRLASAAREGGAVVQVHPRSIDSGCDGTRNVIDRSPPKSRGSPPWPGIG